MTKGVDERQQKFNATITELIRGHIDSDQFFSNYCYKTKCLHEKTRKCNFKQHLERLISFNSTWFRYDIQKYTFLDVLDISIKLRDRIDVLIASGKHQQVIDLQLYKIFARSDADADRAYAEMIHIKTRNIANSTHNRDSHSLRYFTKKYGAENAQYEKDLRYQKSRANRQTCIEYYTSRGMSPAEASIALKLRQTTFSIQTCIDRHGQDLGHAVWLDRQQKWQSTLNQLPQEEIDRISSMKNVYGVANTLKRVNGDYARFFLDLEKKRAENPSIKNLIVPYSDEYADQDQLFSAWIEYAKLRNVFGVEFLDHSKLVDHIRANQFILEDVVHLHDIDRIPAFVFIFHGTCKDDFIKNIHGDAKIIERISGYNYLGHRFNVIYKGKQLLLRSRKELFFYSLLTKYDIDFKVDGRYTNSKFRYDFFLPEFSAYIEICGLMSVESYKTKVYFKRDTFGAILLETEEDMRNYVESLVRNSSISSQTNTSIDSLGSKHEVGDINRFL